jgi:ATP-dependent RNA helicase HelY
VVTPNGHALAVTADDFDAPAQQLGTVVLPGSYAPNRPDYRHEVGRRVKRAKLRRGNRHPTATSDDAADATGYAIEADPQLRQRLDAARRADRVRDEIESLERRAEHRDASLGREFDGVLEILTERGYVDAERWQLSDRGVGLSNLFHECDLLVCEAMFDGLFDGLDAASLAGLVSCFVYEHRSPDDPPRPWVPDADVRDRWGRVARLSERLAADELRRGLSEHRAPDPGFLAVAFAWVGGEGFAELVAEEELTGGDFVRTTKQLIDLLGQIAQTAPAAETRAAARHAADAARRGVVADSSVVGQ